ncbi:MAG: hypothetical protein RID91_07065 [Azospirillaceae bacterium]
MTSVIDDEFDDSFILAAEDWPPNEFDQKHKFSKHDESIIRKLVAHGPILLRGGRGSGKSALMIAAHHRMKEFYGERILSFYISLRYLPLLRSQGSDYDRHFSIWLTGKIRSELADQNIDIEFPNVDDSTSLQTSILQLSERIGKRIVLLFDDAAHIGREKPLTEFFDIFRALSTSTVSCKASIYPGVTEFGKRFDVYNDATVIDIVRNDRHGDFNQFFHNVLKERYPQFSRKSFRTGFDPERFAGIVGRAVVGNMRAFIFACNRFRERDSIGLSELGEGFVRLAEEYYWPLLDEVSPKLGSYEPFVEPTREMGEKLFGFSAARNAESLLIHRDIVQHYSKVFEILEYVGFISRREASRALKSGGRGTVFSLNLCNLLERTSGTRFTSEKLDEWIVSPKDPSEIHRSSSELQSIVLPDLNEDRDLSILEMDISTLQRSSAYPYGLTENKIERLRDAGFDTVGRVAEASDTDIKSIQTIGDTYLRRIRDVVYQAIWM